MDEFFLNQYYLSMSVDEAFDVQQALQQSKESLYFSFSLEFFLQLPLSFCYLYLAYRGKTFYHSNKFIQLLLIPNGLALFFYSLAIVGVFCTARSLIQAGD